MHQTGMVRNHEYCVVVGDWRRVSEPYVKTNSITLIWFSNPRFYNSKNRQVLRGDRVSDLIHISGLELTGAGVRRMRKAFLFSECHVPRELHRSQIKHLNNKIVSITRKKSELLLEQYNHALRLEYLYCLVGKGQCLEFSLELEKW